MAILHWRILFRMKNFTKLIKFYLTKFEGSVQGSLCSRKHSNTSKLPGIEDNKIEKEVTSDRPRIEINLSILFGLVLIDQSLIVQRSGLEELISGLVGANSTGARQLQIGRGSR